MKYLVLLLLLCSCGYQVINGPKGNTGIAGPKGDAGLNGSNCSVAVLDRNPRTTPNGGSLITCPDGSSSVILNGTAGVNGSNGVNGTPGTIVTPIKFCTGFTQSYPSTFAESGLCINNKIYGVYSENGGFLAELLPGTYSSNGINSSCTFKITENCGIQ
jgi:hypothetical protein